jgi:transcriptional regulator with XRE-family HTH domain
VQGALGTAIARQRIAGGIEPAELAYRIGVSADRLSAIEEGDLVSLADILRITDVLGMTISVEPGFRLNATPATPAPVGVRKIS